MPASHSNLTVLHAFPKYLDTNQNWAYRLISSTPNCRITVTSKYFLENRFLDPRFTYFRPWVSHRLGRRTLVRRLHNFAASRFLDLFPYLLPIQAGAVDLIHSHFAPCGWDYRWTQDLLGVAHVISFYGYDYQLLPTLEPVWKDRYLKLFRRATAFLCEGEHGRRTLISMGCPAEKIHVIRLGIVPTPYLPAPRQKDPLTLRMVQLASFVPKKGHLHTALAFEAALRTCPNLHLTFIGAEPDYYKGKVLSKIQESVSPETWRRIEFRPPVEFDQLGRTLAEFDVFIHPSCYGPNGDCEGGAPVVLLDAQSIGLPVISTTHCDIPEEVAHSESGLLTPEGDTAALTESIRTFYQCDSQTFSTFSERAIAHVRQFYDIRRNAAQLRILYDSLLALGRS